MDREYRRGSDALVCPVFFPGQHQGCRDLIELVMEALDPQEDELAVDLYCGAGTFTLPLARRCDFVAAVEAYGPAVRDLRRNLEINKLDNVDVIGGDAVRVPRPGCRRLGSRPATRRPRPRGDRPYRQHECPRCRLRELRPGHPGARSQTLCRRRHLLPRKDHASRPVPTNLPLRDRRPPQAQLAT